LLSIAAWTLLPTGTRTPSHDTGARAFVVVVAVVTGAPVVVVVLVVVGTCVVVVVAIAEKVAEAVRTPPCLRVILAVIVCRPAVGDHGLAAPSLAVPMKSNGWLRSTPCTKPSSRKVTSAILAFVGRKTYAWPVSDCPASATASERSGERLTSSRKPEGWPSSRTGPMIMESSTNMRRQVAILPMERR
jgi:hypothetical protein